MNLSSSISMRKLPWTEQREQPTTTKESKRNDQLLPFKRHCCHSHSAPHNEKRGRPWFSADAAELAEEKARLGVYWWRRIKRLENVTQKLLRLYKSIKDYVFAVLAKFYVSRIWVATMQTEKKNRQRKERNGKAFRAHRKFISYRFCGRLLVWRVQMRRHVKIEIENPPIVVVYIALAFTFVFPFSYRVSHLDVYSSIALHFLRFSHRNLLPSLSRCQADVARFCTVIASKLRPRRKRLDTTHILFYFTLPLSGTR